MDGQRSHRHSRPRRRATLWPVRVVMLLVAVAGATAVPAVWHVAHDVDLDCAVCKLGHEPLADLADDSRAAPPETVAGLPDMLARWVVVVGVSPVPARGPPSA